MPRGYSTRGDVITTTIDGTDVNELWREASAVLAAWNNQRDSLRALVSFATTAPAEEVLQVVGGESFERATEFGVPQSRTVPNTRLQLGYWFEDYDWRNATTWKFLRDASAEQVRAGVNNAIEADNRLVYDAIMARLLNSTAVTATTIGGQVINSLGLYNNDGTTPPAYAGQTFLSTHTHYFQSLGATVAGVDLDQLITSVQEHGYGTTPGSRLLIFCHPDQGKTIRGFRAPTTSADFIPSESAPPYLTTLTLVGDVPPAALGRVPIFGSYGAAWLSETRFFPTGYLLAVATGGVDSPSNVLGFRQHVRPEYRGLRQIPGPATDYPLQDSFFQRSFGTGVRLRGAAAAMKIGAPYAAPAQYTSVIP